VSTTFGIIVFPGSNCDHDAFHALSEVLGVETQFIWHKDTDLSDIDVIVIPGGFSYGDYLRSGAIARFSPIMREVEKAARKGTPTIGICNGFQILLEASLLPGAMMHNQQLRFVCKNVNIRCENNKSIFTNHLQKNEVLNIPVSHGEGNYFIDTDGLKELKDHNQVAFRYCDQGGNLTPESNFNGSVDHIAGIVNREGNILGLMPHPERAVESLLGSTDGLKFFESLLDTVVSA
jgi:phosphoribosylformylglycinamidine synthase